MNDFLINASIFLGGAVVIVTALFIYAYGVLGSIENVKTHFMKTEGKGALFGIALAVLIPVLIAGVVTVAKADEVKYLQDTVIFAGIDSTKKLSPQCYEGGVNDRFTSNLGITQHLVGYKDVSSHIMYTHHSCAINRDLRSYDAIGFRIEWRIR